MSSVDTSTVEYSRQAKDVSTWPSLPSWANDAKDGFLQIISIFLGRYLPWLQWYAGLFISQELIFFIKTLEDIADDLELLQENHKNYAVPFLALQGHTICFCASIGEWTSCWKICGEYSILQVRKGRRGDYHPIAWIRTGCHRDEKGEFGARGLQMETEVKGNKSCLLNCWDSFGAKPTAITWTRVPGIE